VKAAQKKRNRELSPDSRRPANTLGRLNEPQLAGVVESNIRSIEEHRCNAENTRTTQERIADGITRVAGSLWFVWLHTLWFAVWIALNLGLLGIPPFDPFPFGLLTTIVSLEAIFLSTFVLVSQNRQATIADQRAQLDLQINLLAEHELTRILELQDAMAKKLNVNDLDPQEVHELKAEVDPELVLQKLEQNENGHPRGRNQRRKPNDQKPPP
jgi:uncharacterized membrane protein